MIPAPRPASPASAARVALAAGCLVLAACTGCGQGAPALAELPPPKVTVQPVVSQQTQDADEYTGRTEASEVVEVRARVFGYLKSIEFEDGDFVTEGQTLFQIEPDEYQAIHQQSLSRIEVVAARLDLAKANLARNERLVKSGAISQEEYEETIAAAKEAEASIVSAKADANRTSIDLKYTEITAPISGRVDRAFVTRGNLLTGGTGSGTLLTKIVQEQPMYVYFDVDERSLLRYMRLRNSGGDSPGSLRESGLACFLQLADEPDYTHEGQLDFIETEVNPSTGTARVRGVFANQRRELASGLFVRVRVPIGKPYSALLIPESALASDQNLKFVYVVGEDGLAARKPVELGGRRGELRIITAGLAEGDLVVVKGVQRVRPGQKVDVERLPPPAATPPTDATPNESMEPTGPADDTSSS
jgi:RND family efflux transporter MFP subunit